MVQDREDRLSVNRQLLRSIFEAMSALRDLSPTMPVAEAQMFIAVALNEGLSGTELAEIMDMKKSTASRYLLDLSDKTRAGGEGYGLITRETDPQELRRNMYALSPKGRNLVSKIASGVKR